MKLKIEYEHDASYMRYFAKGWLGDTLLVRGGNSFEEAREALLHDAKIIVQAGGPTRESEEVEIT